MLAAGYDARVGAIEVDIDFPKERSGPGHMGMAKGTTETRRSRDTFCRKGMLDARDRGVGMTGDRWQAPKAVLALNATPHIPD